MNKILMAFVALFITVAASAQSGAGCCAHKAKGSCTPKADATSAVAPVAAEQAEDATAPVAAANEVEAPSAAAPVSVEARVAAQGVPCPSRPGCICPNGVKPAAEATAGKAEGATPCPNRPGCVCH